MDFKLVQQLREADIFSPVTAEDAQGREEKRLEGRKETLESFKKAFPGTRFRNGAEFKNSPNAVIWLTSESLDKHGIPLYDMNEEVDWLMRDAGFPNSSYYDGGIAKKLRQWGEENNVAFEPQDGETLIGYWA